MNSYQRVFNKFDLQMFADVEDDQIGTYADESELDDGSDWGEDEEESLEETTEELEQDSETTEETETTSEEQKEEPIDLGEIDFKYLHEAKKIKDIPREELPTIIQKGMNHDRVLEKFTVANEKLDRFEEIAVLHNMSSDEMAEVLLSNFYNTEAERNGTTPEFERRNREISKVSNKEKMYKRFVDKYPDVKSEDIPQYIWDNVKLGEDLTSAYEDHKRQDVIKTKDDELNQYKSKIAKLEAELKVKNQNESVKKKAVVKSTTNNGSDALDEDDFLQGFGN